MHAGINSLVDLEQAVTQRLSMPVILSKNISVHVLRLDKIHATISGNKWFKLRYALQDALQSDNNTIVTFGGAYSNHLLATAYSCARLGLQSIGVIRGEEPATHSPTLLECRQLGMQLHFMSRDAYREKESLHEFIGQQFPGSCVVPEGGADNLGVKGAEGILSLAAGQFTDICCAVGTGTMLAGLINCTDDSQFLTGVSVLKLSDNDNSIEDFVKDATGVRYNYTISYDYHFGGYARKNTQLLEFMNSFYAQTGIPTDFVYTGKLCFGVLDMIEKDQFNAGNSILIIHSGGLQGNRSLPNNVLVY